MATRPIVRVGLLYPLSGLDAARGQMACNAALLAIDEVNARAGRDGPMIAAVSEDTRSDPRRYRAALRRMVWESKVACIFGLIPPDERDDTRSFVERYDGLFWDPAAYEGGECSKNLIHGGATPHQSLKHLVPWLAEQVGGRFLLVGGRDALSSELLRVCRSTLDGVGGEAVGRDVVVAPGHTDFSSVVRAAWIGRIDAVFSTLQGAQAAALLGQMKAGGIDPRQVPVASPTLSEIEVAAAGPAAAGAIAAQPYFASWLSPENWRFMDRMRRRHGAKVAPSALAEATWFQFHLLADALSRLAEGDVHPINIRECAKDCEVAAPQGPVRLEGDTLHTVLWPKIGVVEPSGRVQVLARAREGIKPLPFWAHPGRVCTDGGVRKGTVSRGERPANVLVRRSE